jgi:hypothetical protein
MAWRCPLLPLKSRHYPDEEKVRFVPNPDIASSHSITSTARSSSEGIRLRRRRRSRYQSRFLVPGMSETLGINGLGRVTDDANLLTPSAVQAALRNSAL